LAVASTAEGDDGASGSDAAADGPSIAAEIIAPADITLRGTNRTRRSIIPPPNMHLSKT
jgi:hypothetical protein